MQVSCRTVVLRRLLGQGLISHGLGTAWYLFLSCIHLASASSLVVDHFRAACSQARYIVGSTSSMQDARRCSYSLFAVPVLDLYMRLSV